MIWGIDIGSVSTNIVLLDEKKTIRGYRIGGSGCRHGDVVKEMMKEIRRETGCLDAGEDLIVGTGYGRRNIPGVQYTYTEITAMQKECIIFSRKQIPLSISEDRTVKRSVYPTTEGWRTLS